MDMSSLLLFFGLMALAAVVLVLKEIADDVQARKLRNEWADETIKRLEIERQADSINPRPLTKQELEYMRACQNSTPNYEPNALCNTVEDFQLAYYESQALALMNPPLDFSRMGLWFNNSQMSLERGAINEIHQDPIQNEDCELLWPMIG